MTLFFNSKQKIRNIQRAIDVLLDGEFPVDSGKKALRKLRHVFGELDKKLDRARKLNDSNLIKEISNNINRKMLLSLPVLGFILRSTNVRNAFELLEPLQYIADSALHGKPELLLSSEWDYVPFAYPQSLHDLKSFVLIGLPASEAGSALLMPLAGHELGHAVWRNRGIEGSILTILQYKIEDLYNQAKLSGTFKRHFPDYDEGDIVYKELFPEAIADSVEIAVFQAEEIFCDLFAYAIFGESFVYAFAYILAPGFGTTRRSRYPAYKKRLSSIREVAKSEGVTLPDDGDLSFSPEDDQGNPRERFVVQIAEQSVSDIIGALWGHILKLIADGKIHRPVRSKSLAHLNEIRSGIPTHAPVCLGDIINAGWSYYHELQKSGQSVETLSEEIDTLNEILLKSIEVLEFRRRTLEE
jgi:hypothetical protein